MGIDYDYNIELKIMLDVSGRNKSKLKPGYSICELKTFSQDDLIFFRDKTNFSYFLYDSGDNKNWFEQRVCKDYDDFIKSLDCESDNDDDIEYFEEYIMDSDIRYYDFDVNNIDYRLVNNVIDKIELDVDNLIVVVDGKIELVNMYDSSGIYWESDSSCQIKYDFKDKGFILPLDRISIIVDGDGSVG